jgi:hypothetical protein
MHTRGFLGATSEGERGANVLVKGEVMRASKLPALRSDGLSL